MATKALSFNTVKKTDVEGLKRITSKPIVQLSPKQLERVMLYFIKRNSKFMPSNHDGAFLIYVMRDINVEFGLGSEAKAREKETKLAEALTRLVDKGKIRITFAVEETSGTECVLQISST